MDFWSGVEKDEAMGGLSLSLFGHFQAALDGRPLRGFHSNKVQGLLIYLSVERDRPHRRESLMTLLWPGMPERSARHNLRNTLYQLRRLVKGQTKREQATPFLLSDRQTIQLNPAFELTLDVSHFEALLKDQGTHDHLTPLDCSGCQQALEEAAATYQGAFLEDFYLDDSNQFEDWAAANRQNYQNKALEALEALTAIYIHQSKWNQAERYAQRQLAIDSLREGAHRQRMEALARSGHRAEALRQYRVCVKVLEHELGMTPSQETTTLYERIRAERAQTLAPGVSTHPSSPPQPIPLPSTQVEEPVLFVGREREMDRLAGYLSRSQDGRMQMVFITGDPGRGKTSMMTAFARKAMEEYPDLLVAQGNCNAFSGLGDPYLPFRELLSQLTGDVNGQYAMSPFSNQQARRLWANAPTTMQGLVEHGSYLVDKLVPGGAILDRAQTLSQGASDWLSTIQDFIERCQNRSGGLPQAALFEQYANLLRALAGKSPLLLLLDDLQWADQGSLHLLAHLGQRLGGTRVCLVGTFRPEEVALGRDGERHPLVPILNDIKRRFGELEIDLLESEGEDRRAFVDAVLDAEPNQLGPAFRDQFFERTQGHPLFTVELLRALQERGDLIRDPELGWVVSHRLGWEGLPARVEAVIVERVDRLDKHLRGILAVASVEGEIFTAQVVAQVEGLSERALFQVLTQELEAQHQLVRESGELRVDGQYLIRYRFTHGLFQEYFYQGLGAGEQRLLHGEVAAALEALYAGQIEQVLAELAYHYTAAGWDEQAVIYLRKAGMAATARYANQEAVSYFSQALEMLSEDDIATRFMLLEGREKAQDLQGDRETQQSGLDRLAVLASDLGATFQARVAIRQAFYAFVTGDYDHVIRYAQAALEWATQTEALYLAAEGHILLGSALTRQGQYSAAQVQLKIGLRLAQEISNQEHEAQCWNDLGLVSWYQGDFTAARRHYEQSLAIFREIGDRQGEGMSLRNLGNVAGSQGNYAAAGGYIEQSLMIFQKIGARREEGWSLTDLGVVVWFQGDYATARVYTEQSLAISRETDDQSGEGSNLGNLGVVAWLQGDYAAARVYYEQSLAIFRQIGERRGEGTLFHELGEVALDQGEYATARTYFEQALAILREIGDRRREGLCLSALGALALEENDLSQAESCYQQALTIHLELTLHQYQVEDLAGLAKVMLAQEDVENARVYAEQILNYLQEHPLLHGLWNQMRAFHFIWEVWGVLDETIAHEVLALAAAVIQAYLDNNSDSAAQEMYLTQPHHAVLWMAWREKMAD